MNSGWKVYEDLQLDQNYIYTITVKWP